MTMQMTPNYTMNCKASGAILLDVERKLRRMEATEKKTESTYAVWQQLVEQHAAPAPMLTSDNDAAPLVGALLTGLLDMLFGGLPVMQTLAHGLAAGVAVDHATREKTPRVTPLYSVSKINQNLKASQKNRYTTAASVQDARREQMMALLQMAINLRETMLTEHSDETTGSGSDGDGMMVLGPLDSNISIKRFKQNQHSISCIRTMFARQAEMTVPCYTRASRPVFN